MTSKMTAQKLYCFFLNLVKTGFNLALYIQYLFPQKKDLWLLFFSMAFDSKVTLNSYYIELLELRALLELGVLLEERSFRGSLINI